MSHFLESLESRTFLSVSPAVTTLHSDESVLKNDVKVIKADGSSTIKTITAALKAQDLLKIDKSQVTQLAKDGNKVVAAISKVANSAQSKVNADVNKLEAIEAQLAKKPGNAGLIAKESATATKLEDDAAAALAAFPNAESGTAAIADYNAIEADGGVAGADAGSALTMNSNAGTVLHVADILVYSTDVSAFLGQ